MAAIYLNNMSNKINNFEGRRHRRQSDQYVNTTHQTKLQGNQSSAISQAAILQHFEHDQQRSSSNQPRAQSLNNRQQIYNTSDQSNPSNRRGANQSSSQIQGATHHKYRQEYINKRNARGGLSHGNFIPNIGNQAGPSDEKDPYHESYNRQQNKQLTKFKHTTASDPQLQN